MQSVNYPKESLYRFDSFQIDPVKRTLLRDGNAVALTSKRFEILLFLVRNRDRVVSKDELMQAVWPDTTVEETNLTHNISALRKALGEKLGEHRFILTIPGQGYRFVADLSATDEENNSEIIFERTRSRLIIEENIDQRFATPNADSNNLHPPQIASNTLDKTASNVSPAIDTSVSRLAQKKRVALVTAVLMLAISGAALAVYLFALGKSAEPLRNIRMTRITTSGRAAIAVISPDSKYLAYVIEDAQGQSLWIRHISTSSNVCIVPAAHIQFWGIAFSPDGDYVYYCTFDSARSRDNLYRVAILGGPSMLLPVETNSPVTFSPDGKRFAYVLPAGSETHLLVANADGTGISKLARVTQPDFFLSYPGGPSWSPDGKTIACSKATTGENGVTCSLVGIRVEDGEQFPITRRRFNYIGQAGWTSDGSGILFTATEKPATQNQIYLLSIKTDEVRKITNDLNDYSGISLSSDSASLVTVQSHTVSTLQVADADDFDSAVTVGSETGQLNQIAFADNGSTFYSSTASGELSLWSVSPGENNKKEFLTPGLLDLGFTVSPGGHQIVYTSNRAGTINLWRYDDESKTSHQLTYGQAEIRPHFSTDGRWVIYERGFGNVKKTLWRVSTEGNEQVQLTDFHAIRPALSPDGRLIAFYFIDHSQSHSPWRIGIISSDGGEIVKKFDIPAVVTSRFLNWTADSQSIAYIEDIGGVSNIWTQPVGGERPRQIASFKSGRILAFDWSQDGKQILFSQAIESSYVALVNLGNGF